MTCILLVLASPIASSRFQRLVVRGGGTRAKNRMLVFKKYAKNTVAQTVVLCHSRPVTREYTIARSKELRFYAGLRDLQEMVLINGKILCTRQKNSRLGQARVVFPRGPNTLLKLARCKDQARMDFPFEPNNFFDVYRGKNIYCAEFPVSVA